MGLLLPSVFKVCPASNLAYVMLDWVSWNTDLITFFSAPNLQRSLIIIQAFSEPWPSLLNQLSCQNDTFIFLCTYHDFAHPLSIILPPPGKPLSFCYACTDTVILLSHDSNVCSEDTMYFCEISILQIFWFCSCVPSTTLMFARMRSENQGSHERKKKS